MKNKTALIVSDRELAAILAGLRLWESHHSGGRMPKWDVINEISSDCGKLKPLAVTEIAALCERINTPEANAGLFASAPILLAHLRILSAEDSQCAADWVQKKKAARVAIAEAEVSK
ncbi:MAG: hypothetical protein ABW223_10820 [Rariglobus sp.]